MKAYLIPTPCRQAFGGWNVMTIAASVCLAIVTRPAFGAEKRQESTEKITNAATTAAKGQVVANADDIEKLAGQPGWPSRWKRTELIIEWGFLPGKEKVGQSASIEWGQQDNVKIRWRLEIGREMGMAFDLKF